MKKTNRLKESEQPKPVVLFRDEAMITDMVNKLNGVIPHAQRVVDAYFKLPFIKPEENPSFFDIMSNTEERAKQYIRDNTPDTVNVAGLTLNKAKFAQFLELEGMDQYAMAKEAFRASGGDGLTSYLKIENKAVEISEEALQRYADRYIIKAETPEDIEMYYLWQGWVEATNSFSTYMRKKRDMLVLTPNGTHIPNASAFLRLDKTNTLVVNHITFQAAQRQLKG